MAKDSAVSVEYFFRPAGESFGPRGLPSKSSEHAATGLDFVSMKPRSFTGIVAHPQLLRR